MANLCKVCGRPSNEMQVSFCTSYGGYLCSKHKNQWLRHGRFTDGDKALLRCEICGKKYDDNSKIYWCSGAELYLCNKHRSQFTRLGLFLNKTKRDKNTFIIKDNYAEILFDKDGANLPERAIIDIEDVEKCKELKWHITEAKGNTRYVRAVDGDHMVYLHQYVMDSSGREIVDHINRNGLDNRKENLRIVTASENCVNSVTRSKTGEKNIYFKNGKYQVQIVRNYKNSYCKTFDTLDEAIVGRDLFIEKYNIENERKV